jgi:N utilization substance protein B
VERAILRLASAELLHRIDVPYRVVIDEYVELAKLFGAQDSFKYIKGVLDKLATQVRVAEVGQRE